VAKALIRLAWLGKAHGLKGEIKAESTGDDIAWLEDAKELWLERDNSKPEKVELERAAGAGGTFRVKLKGVDDRDAAEALRGTSLSVEADTLPQPPEGSFWIHQVIGYKITDAKRGELGTLKAVVPTGANDCFEVQPQGRDSYLVPVTDHTLQDVDHEAQVISMDLLEGSVPGEIEDED
jgi:16S rRNA processing protein RimM